MPIGRYGSGSIALRAGAEANQSLEIIHQDLNTARGTAYNVEDGSAVYYENYGYAKSLQDMYETNRRFANQFDPETMYQFLPRWESILGIIVPPNASVQDRQHIISLFFQRWSRPPTLSNLMYFAQQLLGNCFVGFQLYDSMQQGVSFIPGGLAIPGGATLYNSNWKSYVSFIRVVVWQPSDKYGNKLLDDSSFTAISKNFFKFFNSYLPSYVSFNYFQYSAFGTGSVSGFLQDNILHGTGTNFTSIFGKEIFLVDDNGNPQLLEVASIQSDTKLTLVKPLFTSITGCKFWAYQSNCFNLDQPNNLDNLVFCS